MTVVLLIVWSLLLLISVAGIYQTIGLHLMVQYFPEGKRWWMFPSQIVALAVFAAVITFHPFGA